ncbi:MAG: tRNA epoxyqueuosine(34) reductase QueG [Alphaproteobacteria bacterium]|nr:tRNA epoxyqueuosine(34) reductase QueG [Alphaproteobacteria bacterium]
MNRTPAPVALLKAEAAALGFDAVGVAALDEGWAAAARLTEFLAAGRHGDMDWLAREADRRAHPKALWPAAETAVIVGLSYAPPDNPLNGLERRGEGAVSVYAARRDYHDALKTRLKALARWIAETHGGDVKVFVDTAPLMEKPLAERAGLGWQGKHTNLVSRAHGSWLFLGAVLTEIRFTPDDPHTDHCGQCRACLDACPTDAFPAPYQLDARRCIAYLTIEHKGHIAEEFRAAIGNRVFGCDDCLAVCPWNKFAAAARDQRLALRGDIQSRPLGELAALDGAGFRALFAGTPVKRTGRDRFVRNVLIAIGNSSDRDLAPAAERLLRDPAPLVRAMAVWALRRLLDAGAFARLRSAHAAGETDAAVAAEWRAQAAAG